MDLWLTLAVLVGAVLRVQGEWARIDALRRRHKRHDDPVAPERDPDDGDARPHADMMVAAGSWTSGHTVASMRSGHAYRACARAWMAAPDFTRSGIPLRFRVMATLLIPRYFPFRPTPTRVESP